MKLLPLIVALLVVSCSKENSRKPAPSGPQDEAEILQEITSLYNGLERAYNLGGMNTDSLIDAYYEHDVQYVTPWGSTEPLDSTKTRLRNAIGHMKNYSHRIESEKVKSYGDVAYAYFVLRQNYDVDGTLLDEYLPTTLVLERRGSGWKIVHAHRSTDYETFQQYVTIQQKRAATK
jgi:ketosteroid isomerase-like protein